MPQGRGKGSWPRVFWKVISGDLVTSQPSLVIATDSESLLQRSM